MHTRTSHVCACPQWHGIQTNKLLAAKPLHLIKIYLFWILSAHNMLVKAQIYNTNYLLYSYTVLLFEGGFNKHKIKCNHIMDTG